MGFGFLSKQIGFRGAKGVVPRLVGLFLTLSLDSCGCEGSDITST
jgi:hypothetical protein